MNSGPYLPPKQVSPNNPPAIPIPNQSSQTSSNNLPQKSVSSP